MELELELNLENKNFILNENLEIKKSHFLNEILHHNWINIYKFNVKNSIELLTNTLDNGEFKPLILGRHTYLEFNKTNDPNKFTHSYSNIKGNFTIEECKNEFIKYLQKSHYNSKIHIDYNDIKAKVKRDGHLEIKSKFGYESTPERWLENRIYDLKKIEANNLVIYNDNVYSINILDKNIYFSFENKNEVFHHKSRFINKLSSFENMFQQFKYLDILLHLNKISIIHKK